MAKKSKDDLGKELMQCIAFAHFAVYKYSEQNSENHEQMFYDLFDPDIDTDISEYKKYLSNHFQFDRIFSNWKTTTTQSTKEKSVHIDVKIVYDVSKNFFKKNLISRNFSIYQFLDQSDEFMDIIKTKCLNKIIEATKLPFKFDILSSADIYIVRKSEKRIIKKDFEDEILKQSNSYLINNFDKYNQILEEYWEKHSLFGVSLKLPTSNGAKNIKIIGTPKNLSSKKMLSAIDPYSRFIAMLSDPKQDPDKLIEETVFIHTKPDIYRKASWDFPVTFRYRRLDLYEKDVKFILSSWPYAQGSGGGAAGFNGKFVNTPGYASQWVGGTGIKTLETFLFQYPEFTKINRELISIRQKAFNYTLTGNKNKAPNINQQIETDIKLNKPIFTGREFVYTKKGKYSKLGYLKGQQGIYDYGKSPSGKKTYTMQVKNLQTLYSIAKRDLSKSQFAVGVGRNESIVKFFEEYEKVTGRTGILNDYRTAVVNLTLGKQIGMKNNESDSMIRTHYEHSQLSYFLTRGGMRFERYLKQRIFLTVFGVITKKSYKIFLKSNGELDSTKIVNAIVANVSKALIKNKKEFDTVPHFYMS